MIRHGHPDQHRHISAASSIVAGTTVSGRQRPTPHTRRNAICNTRNDLGTSTPTIRFFKQSTATIIGALYVPPHNESLRRARPLPPMPLALPPFPLGIGFANPPKRKLIFDGGKGAFFRAPLRLCLAVGAISALPRAVCGVGSSPPDMLHRGTGNGVPGFLSRSLAFSLAPRARPIRRIWRHCRADRQLRPVGSCAGAAAASAALARPRRRAALRPRVVASRALARRLRAVLACGYVGGKFPDGIQTGLESPSRASDAM